MWQPPPENREEESKSEGSNTNSQLSEQALMLALSQLTAAASNKIGFQQSIGQQRAVEPTPSRLNPQTEMLCRILASNLTQDPSRRQAPANPAATLSLNDPGQAIIVQLLARLLGSQLQPQPIQPPQTPPPMIDNAQLIALLQQSLYRPVQQPPPLSDAAARLAKSLGLTPARPEQQHLAASRPAPGTNVVHAALLALLLAPPPEGNVAAVSQATSSRSYGQAISAYSNVTADVAHASPPPSEVDDFHPFPVKLYHLLEKADREGYTNIISWTFTGRAFRLLKPKDFFLQIVPRYFKHKNLGSFRRQLSMYGFDRIPRGPEEGAFTHFGLVRGRPDLAAMISRSNGRVRRNEWQPNFGVAPQLLAGTDSEAAQERKEDEE
jgi:hypothetical protein